MLLQFRKIDSKKEKEIFNYLRKTPRIGYCLKTIGNWDCFISIKVTNLNEFYDFLEKFHRHFSKNIKNESISLERKGIETNLKFLDKKSSMFEIQTIKTSKEKYEFTNLEKKIFLELRADPLINYIDLSNKLRKSYGTIKKTIENLQTKGIIKGIKAKINTEKLGYERYLFLINVYFLDKKKLDKLFDYLKKNKKINYSIECVGQWNIICNTYSKNINELVETINDLKDNFQKSISSIEFLRVIEDEKESFEIEE